MPPASKATATGSGRIVGPGAGEPHDDASVPVGVEQLHAAVDRVGHGADAAGVGRDAHRRVELPGRAARGAERAQQRAALVEDVDAVVAGVGHVDVAGRVDRDPARVGEPARAPCRRSPSGPCTGYTGAAAEAHDAVVEVVGDEDAPGRVGGHAVGEVELAGARAVLARPRAAGARRCRRRRGGGAGRRPRTAACRAPRSRAGWRAGPAARSRRRGRRRA